MKIELKRIDDAFHMEASNENGKTVLMDGKPTIGGKSQSMSPMEVLIASLGGCSSIDVIHFMNKLRQNIDSYQVKIDAQRDPKNIPALFTTINVHYILTGKDLKESSVEKAIKLSMEKYCSVVKILEKTAEITWSYEILPA